MLFRNIPVALLLVPALTLAAEAENSVTTEKAAIAIAQSACPQSHIFNSWTARETATAWEVQGLYEGGIARAVVSVRKNGAHPLGCSIILEQIQSRYLRPL